MPRRILIADDERDIRQLLAATLDYGGYASCTATNGAEAVQMLKDNTDIDIVLLDVMMPVMSGDDAAQLIRETITDRYVYIIVLTSLSDARDIKRAGNVGANDYLTKPFAADDLLYSIKNAILFVTMKNQVSPELEAVDKDISGMHNTVVSGNLV